MKEQLLKLGNLWFFKRYISKETIATDAEN